MVWRQLPKLVPAGSIPVSCSIFKRPKLQTICIFGRFLHYHLTAGSKIYSLIAFQYSQLYVLKILTAHLDIMDLICTLYVYLNPFAYIQIRRGIHS